jgi:hypothetical protein
MYIYIFYFKCTVGCSGVPQVADDTLAVVSIIHIGISIQSEPLTGLPLTVLTPIKSSVGVIPLKYLSLPNYEHYRSLTIACNR